MFYVIHRQLPDAGIYYFNISQRSYDATKIGIVATVNDIMAAWCAGREWITLIDTSSLLTNDMLRDGVHPKNEYYYIFTDALAKTDIVISDAPIKEGVSFTAGTFDKTENKFTLDAAQRVRSYLVDGESEYSGNFAVSGTAAISGTGWTEFIINKSPADDWFKTDSSLPISNITFTNGNSEIWGYKNGGKKASLAEVADGTFSFSVIAFNKSVLFKVNDSVVVYNDDGFTGTYFGFGAENAKLSITELSIVINDDTTVRAKYDAAAPVPSDTIDDIIRLESQRISDGSVTIAYKGALLNRNYILTGKLDIVSSGRNGHAEFKFSGDNNRILLWDNNTDGNWKVGYACGGAYNSNAPAKDIFVKESGKTLTLEWKLVVTDNDVYFYVNNALRLVWKGVPGSDITLSTENVGGKFYDMSALTLKDDKAEYDTAVAGMKSVIDSYAASGAGMYRA